MTTCEVLDFPTLVLTDLDDCAATWSPTGNDSGTGCNVGVLMVCVRVDIAAQNFPEILELKLIIADDWVGSLK